MKFVTRIEKKLIENFSPNSIEVLDESYKHAGHVGARPGGETHFKIKMTSKAFIGQTRIECQRLVYRVLRLELEERIHALSLELAPPESKDDD